MVAVGRGAPYALRQENLPAHEHALRHYFGARAGGRDVILGHVTAQASSAREA